MQIKRGYVGGKYAFELDGLFAGWIFSAEGGMATSDVVTEAVGTDHLAKKHVAGVKYEDMSVVCGAGMSSDFYDWIQETVQLKYGRRNGAIVAADYDHKERTRLSFYNALITEFIMPALDATSKEAAKMTIKISPEYTRQTSTGSGPTIHNALPNRPEIQKLWMPSNFRLRIDGLEDPCRRVAKIESLTVKQKVVEFAVGEMRDYEREPAKLEVPNLVFTLPESHADPLFKWHEDFIIKGNSGNDKERTGSLEYLSSDLQTVLFTLNFYNLGIFKLTPDKMESGNEQIRRVKAEMYCEKIEFKYSKNWG